MTTATNMLDKIVSQQVSLGIYSNVEVEQELSARLLERELDRKINQGRQDIINGNFTPVNEQTTTAFITHLSKKLITENNYNETL